MRKIDLRGYPVDGTQELYAVKGSIVEALYAPALKLSARGILDNDRVAQKINAASDEVLLEEADYEKVKAAFETITGYTRNDLELVKRILNAEKVEVEEKK